MEKDILFYQKEAIKHLEAYKKELTIVPYVENYLGRNNSCVNIVT